MTRAMCFMGREGAHITCDVRQKVYVHLLFVEFRRTYVNFGPTASVDRLMCSCVHVFDYDVYIN